MTGDETTLSIYTSPPPWWRGMPFDGMRWWKRSMLWRGLRCLKACFLRCVGGHYAVTRSLLAGMRQIGLPFSYNYPLLPSRTALVLAGLDTLRFAIEQKRAGRIDFLAAGPNICVAPSLCDNMVADAAVDVYLVNSEWTRRMYVEDCPALDGRIAVWPAGVDADFWSRRNPPRRRHVLLYVKNDHAPIGAVQDVLARLHLAVTVLRYGEYTTDSFKALLESSECMICMGGPESQGIALAEAWAMDVPTFVWSGADRVWPVPAYASSAPYLSEETGAFWGECAELEAALESFYENRQWYSPRKYVLRELTDEVSAVKLMHIVALYRGVSNGV